MTVTVTVWVFHSNKLPVTVTVTVWVLHSNKLPVTVTVTVINMLAHVPYVHTFSS